MKNLADVDYHAVAFKTQRAVPKKAVMKCKAGTWLEVKWKDAPNSIVLLLEKPENNPGDVCLKTYDPVVQDVSWKADSNQVIRIVGPLQVPPAFDVITLA